MAADWNREVRGVVKVRVGAQLCTTVDGRRRRAAEIFMVADGWMEEETIGLCVWLECLILFRGITYIKL